MALAPAHVSWHCSRWDCRHSSCAGHQRMSKRMELQSLGIYLLYVRMCLNIFPQSCRAKNPKRHAAPAKCLCPWQQHPLVCSGGNLGVTHPPELLGSAEGTTLQAITVGYPVSSGSRPMLSVREMWQSHLVGAESSRG